MSTENKKKESIQVEGAPEIRNLKFRGFRGEQDYPHMLAVIKASIVEDGVEYSTTLEDISNGYAHLDNCDPYQDMLFAEVNGKVIAYSRVWWRKEHAGDQTYSSLGNLTPEWRRKGIGTAMLHYNQNRLRQIAGEHSPESPKIFQIWSSDAQIALTKLLESNDYQPARYFFDMTRPISNPIPESPMPDALEVRTVSEEDFSKVFQANDEGFQDHWGHVPNTENNIKQWMESPTFNPELWKVAWDGDEVAGMVLNFVNEKENEEYDRKRGYTEEIVVRRPWRSRGLAKALIAQSISMFRDMGMQETALGVDTQNLSGALKLYEYMGYKQMKRNALYRKPMV